MVAEITRPLGANVTRTLVVPVGPLAALQLRAAFAAAESVDKAAARSNGLRPAVVGGRSVALALGPAGSITGSEAVAGGASADGSAEALGWGGCSWAAGAALTVTPSA
jgi:hypothetical protein